MRDTFIGLFEKFLRDFVLLLCVGVLIASFAAFLSSAGGMVSAILTLRAGTTYVILMGGMMYLFVGIYKNTKRTAEAVEELAKRQLPQ